MTQCRQRAGQLYLKTGNRRHGGFAENRYRWPIERLACSRALLAPNRRTLFPFEGMRSRVHPSDVATRRCTSRVLVTGLLERIVVYSPDYWHNLAITGQRSNSLGLRFQGWRMLQLEGNARARSDSSKKSNRARLRAISNYCLTYYLTTCNWSCYLKKKKNNIFCVISKAC